LDQIGEGGSDRGLAAKRFRLAWSAHRPALFG